VQSEPRPPTQFRARVGGHNKAIRETVGHPPRLLRNLGNNGRSLTRRDAGP
jgi:hypothetical protein